MDMLRRQTSLLALPCPLYSRRSLARTALAPDIPTLVSPTSAPSVQYGETGVTENDSVDQSLIWQLIVRITIETRLGH